MRLALLPLLLLPFLELWLMISVGNRVGALPVIIWVVVMILFGMKLLRFVGPASMFNVARDMRAGKFPGGAIADGLFKAIGAVLLVIPGFITDALALICFIPFMRRLFLLSFLRKLFPRARNFAAGNSAFRNSTFRNADVGNSPFEQQAGKTAAGFNRRRGNVYEHTPDTQPHNQREPEVLEHRDDAANTSKPSPRKNS